MTLQNLIFTSALFSTILLASCSDSQEVPYFETETYNNQKVTRQANYENYNHNDNPSDQQYGNPTHTSQTSQVMQKATQPISNGNEQLIMQPLMDTQSGMPYGHYPLPNTWSIKKDGWHGPNGIKVEFFYEPMQSSQQVPYQSPQQFLNSRLKPLITKEGGTVLSTYDLPAVAKNQQDYNNMMLLEPNIQNTEVAVLGVDVEKTNEPGVVLIQSIKSNNPYQTMWQQSMIVLTAKPANINKAKQTLINALSNFKPHMPQIQQFMHNERVKSNRSWAEHNDRMRRNQRNFEATNQATQNAYAAVNEATMNTYRSQSSSFDRSNQAYQNGIYNENTVTNPYDGTAHQTDAMYDRTFMNAFGEQVQTNDQFYTPETGYQEVYPNGGGY